MAYDFGNPMMAALLASQQNAMQTSPSLNIGRAISSVQVPQFDNPWATFLASLGTNLLGSGLQSYAYANNANETADLSNQLAGILSNGMSAKEQQAQLAQDANLGFLSNMPNLMEAQRAQEQQQKMADALLSQGGIYDPKTGTVSEIPGFGDLQMKQLSRRAAADNAVNVKQLINDLQGEIDKNQYYTQVRELAPNIEMMGKYIDSTDPESDAIFTSAMKQAFQGGAFKDEKGMLEQLPVVGKLFSGGALNPEEKANTYQLIADKYQTLANMAAQDYSNVLQQAGQNANRLRLPQLPQIQVRQKAGSEPDAIQKAFLSLDSANKSNEIPKAWTPTTKDKVVPPNKVRFRDTKTGKYYLADK